MSEGARSPALVIPVRNEGEGFRRTWEVVAGYLPPGGRAIVVYDAPDDTTVPVLEALARDDARLVPLCNTLGRGVPNALRAGFAAAGPGPVVVVMGDLSDDLGLLPAMLALYEAGAGVVCPSRYMPGGALVGGPRLKGWLSRLAGLVLYGVGALPVRDATNNYRLYDGAWLAGVEIESAHGFEVALELTCKAHWDGLRVVELPTVWRDRTWGRSNFRLVRSLRHYLRWWMRALVRRPSRAPR